MPAPAKQLSPAELAALERAFAADPSSEAYRPLTEVYLGMKRFMEAMVVCKKGVKAYPTDPAPRVLLARIYAAQGKTRKALEELQGALAVKVDDVAANRMAGLLQLELGEKDAGEAALRRAHAAAPADPETLEAMSKWGVATEVAKPTPPPPVPVPAPAAPTSTAPSTATPTPTAIPTPASSADASSSAGPPVLQPAPPAAAPIPPPVRRPPARAPRNPNYSEELAERYGTREYGLASGGAPAARRQRSRAPVVATVGLGLALVAVLAGWAIVGSMRRARAVEIDRALKQSRELIEKDSYASYKEAAKLCEGILDRDPDALGGHAYLAYIDAIRWGEHGESEGLRDEAKKHLDAVAKLGREHSHAIAAQAYVDFHSGDARGALDRLKKVMQGPEGGSALLHGTAGVIEMQAGDLDAARDDLEIAHRIAPGDVRTTQMLGEQWRRRGQGFEVKANAFYDTALTRLAPDHVPSLLGKAQLLLDAGLPDEAGKRVQKVLDMGQTASPRQAALAHVLRGSVLHAQGKTAEGDREEQQALALEPSNPDIQDLVGKRKLRGGDSAGAAEAFARASEIDPARVAFYVDLASALLARQGGAKQAVAALEKATSRAGNPRVQKLLGDAYRADGDLDRARASYEKAIEGEKKFADARIALSRVWRERKEWGRALEELDRAVKDYGEGTVGSATAWDEIADVEEARGAPPEAAERAYTAAIKADPTNCPALFWLGRSRSEKKGRTFDPALARQMLSDYVRLCPRAAHVGDAQRIVVGLR